MNRLRKQHTVLSAGVHNHSIQVQMQRWMLLHGSPPELKDLIKGNLNELHCKFKALLG